jgi:primosomal protein N' (replication factor Y)
MATLYPIAHVVVEQPLPYALDYLIPPEHQALCRIGQRVLVPLGHRQVLGYIVALAQRSDVATLKMLCDVLDEAPLLTPELLRLTQWVAEYYLCPWGQVLKAAVPEGFRVRSDAVYGLTSTAHAHPETWPRGRATALLQHLAQHGPQRQRHLTQTLDIPNLGPLVRRLQQQGLIVREQQRQPPKVRQRTLTQVRLCLSSTEAEALRQQLEGRAPNQAAVLRLLQAQPVWNLPALAQRVSGARAAVKRLVQRAAVDLTEVEQLRAVTPTVPPSDLVPPLLNAAQQQAFERIAEKLAQPDGTPFLLHGVTGSGKTEVYMRAIAAALELGKTALVLVPEISLTAQAVDRFAARFGTHIAVLHSGLSAGERFDEWRRLARGQARIAIGARSAVFAPLAHLGLIIVDEEHDTSYKQEEAPRYHARDVAIVRAQQNHAVIVLGSATPALESFYHTTHGKYHALSLPHRVEDKPLPHVTIIDQRHHATPNERVISTPLRHAIAARLQRREQCLVLINRRGFAAYLQCRDCGTIPQCTQCSVSLTYHRRDRTLKCHYCDVSQPAPTVCTACQGAVLRLFGLGTQQVEEVLQTLFPDARIGRMDRDTTRGKAAHQRILGAVGRGDLDILIGTQMIAKGHDYPNITLVGVIAADGALAIPDFRAPERLFQLLTQVAGRAGRGEVRGEVFIQTYRPEHYSLGFAKHHDFLGFFRQEMVHRHAALYPPYTRLAKLLCESTNPERVSAASQQLATLLQRHIPDARHVMLLGPAEAPVARIQNRYRWHMLLKSSSSRLLHQCLTSSLADLRREPRLLRGVRISVDIDPLLFL